MEKSYFCQYSAVLLIFCCGLLHVVDGESLSTVTRLPPSPSAKPLLLTFVRHAQTNANKKKIMQGHSESALTRKGKRQARDLGVHFSDHVFTRVITSDLMRTRDTAKLILEQSKNPPKDSAISEDPRLREKSNGVFDGKSFSAFVSEATRKGIPVRNYTPAGGENKEDLNLRVQSFFDEIVKLADICDDVSPKEDILIVTHGIWLRVLIKYLTTANQELILTNVEGVTSARKRLSKNTGVTQVEVYPLKDKFHELRIIKLLRLYDYLHLKR